MAGFDVLNYGASQACGIYRSADEEERHLQHAVDPFLRDALRRD
jgi:hypothetical protein